MLAFLISVVYLPAQTTVYLRAGGPAGSYVTGASDSGVSPFHLIVKSTAGLSTGDIISVANVCANDGANFISVANGIRKIASINSGTDLTITDLNGNALTANGNWCNGGSTNWPSGAQYIGKLTSFPLTDQPRGWFDGSSGATTRKWALGTQNGLTSLVCASNVCTVTTSYPHGVTAGNHITVWGTTNAKLNNGRAASADWVVNAAGLTPTQFTFNANGVTGGTYTTNAACGPGTSPNGTIQGSDNCVRISQLATLNNPIWSVIYPNLTTNIIANNRYKSIGDDPNGSLGSSFGPVQVAQSYWAPIGTLFLVDQSNAQALSALMYILTHLHRLGGAGFNANELTNEGGSGELGDYGSYIWEALSPVYTAGAPYLTPPQKTTALSRIYADISDSPACTKATFQQKVLASGTAQGGSSNTVILSGSDSQADNYYVNNVIAVTVGGGKSFGLVTGYLSSSKTATVASWSSGAPASGAAYVIYATISRSGTTITGYNTTFTSDVSAGDTVYAGNVWPGSPATSGTYVTNIASDTSLSGRNGAYAGAPAPPSIYWYANQPQSDSACGFKWMHNHWYGSQTSQPISYPANGGAATAIQATQPIIGSNNGFTFDKGRQTMDLVAADDEPRAVTDLAAVNTFYWDYQMSFLMTYVTGFAQSGSHYSFARTLQDGPSSAWALGHSVPGYPNLDTTGPWITAPSLLKMYSAMPDTPARAGYGATWYPTMWGAASTDFINSAAGSGQAGQNYVADSGSEFAPMAPSSQYFQDWLNAHSGYQWAKGVAFADAAIKLDPRSPRSPYTAQPLQYLFGATSFAACTSLFGTCPFNQALRADAFISRTGWSSNSDTLLLLQARGFAGDHDEPEPGSVQLYKAGFLLANDTFPVGASDNDPVTNNQFDATKNDVAFEFQGKNTIKQSLVPGQTETANIIRWASANHGTWPTAYGDQNSRFAYALIDLSGAYTTTYNRVQRHVAHLKAPGLEEIIVQYDDVDVSNAPTAVRNQVHYPQNGEVLNTQPRVYYDEGTTVCPGSGGCTSLDATRQILEQENGASSPGDPNRVFNLITAFFSPPGTTMTVRWDGSSYPGGNGHTNRVSLCGGSSCGAPVSALEDVIVHKIASQPDTTLTVKALNPDSKWTGVQTADKVVLFARAGNKPITVTFQTDHAGTAQYLIAGLQGGMVYRVHNNGVVGGTRGGQGGTQGAAPSDIARQLVSEGDNVLYFEAPAGSYTIGPDRLGGLLFGNEPFIRPIHVVPILAMAFLYYLWAFRPAWIKRVTGRGVSAFKRNHASSHPSPIHRA
jgi:hypothetical protein